MSIPQPTAQGTQARSWFFLKRIEYVDVNAIEFIFIEDISSGHAEVLSCRPDVIPIKHGRFDGEIFHGTIEDFFMKAKDLGLLFLTAEEWERTKDQPCLTKNGEEIK